MTRKMPMLNMKVLTSSNVFTHGNTKKRLGMVSAKSRIMVVT